MKQYYKKIENQGKEQEAKCKKLLKEGNKNRALIALKHKKFMEKELDKVNGAEMLLQETINGIEQAKQDINVMEAMKTGN